MIGPKILAVQWCYMGYKLRQLLCQSFRPFVARDSSICSSRNTIH